MRTYYRARDAVVTSELFVRLGPSAKAFAIRDLRGTGIAGDRGNDRARLLCTATAIPVTVAAGVTASITGSLYALALAVLAASGTVVAAAVWRRRPARWELRASYRGTPVTLYTCCDPTTFHQVARALRRAIEDDRRPPVVPADDAA